MKFEGYVELGLAICDFEFEVDDGATEVEIETAARETVFSQLSWAYCRAE